jgi:hypothetical protein
LIFQWEQIIEQMKRRDEDVDRVATELARFKAEVRAIQSLVNEKKVVNFNRLSIVMKY